ncbi:hypothetical protein EG68_05827 [Paragonimus skrjabini miyazakii]|uniref:Multiple inositol polyphosphate phosphatase 1 n=1 Tax=Paragonimus skrjabini miyazakii TaxID=59628 RepID=A0A8S9YR40_9TREM|nr:hypothetical protein EG68_05827 [Paragonimus skrjabini miyazakii]
MGLAYVTNSFVAFVLGLLSVIVLNSDRTDDFPVSGLSTKTAYRHCSLVPFRDAARDQLHANCQAVHVNALFRHGTRAPSRKNVASFQDLYNRLSSRLVHFLSRNIHINHTNNKVANKTCFLCVVIRLITAR